MSYSLSTVGQLLVATPELIDPNFNRTVIYMLQHGQSGALGLVLNRSTPHDLPDSLERWKSRAALPPVVFRGGPVQPEGIIALGRQQGAMAETVDLVNVEPDDFDDVRLFHGYAGWGTGQVEDEINEGSWFVVDSDSDDIFTPEPDALWHLVLGRQPQPLSWLAHYPEDPAVN